MFEGAAPIVGKLLDKNLFISQIEKLYRKIFSIVRCLWEENYSNCDGSARKL